MPAHGPIPSDPLEFIKKCIDQGKIFWTYHVNMRFGQRPIRREMILNTVSSFEIIEEYSADKYLPSYLIRAEHQTLVFHIQIATDVALENIRIVTAYIPDPGKWSQDFRVRR